jgi:N-methylhydantoinase A
MSYAVAVDIGGTFTDLVAFDHQAGSVAYAKSPTTYGNFVEGILSCFEKAKVSPRDVKIASHGTTLVINSLIERKGANAALVTTKGFRDLVEIGRGNRADPLDLHFRRNDPFISRDRRFEVVERMDATGKEHQALDVDGLKKLAAQLKDLGTESIAIFFLHSYLNPGHEQQAAEVLKKELPGTFVTVSTELCREVSEYERVSTVVANAYVGPLVEKYVRRLEKDLGDRGFDGGLFMMGSNGGLLSVERTCRQPVALVESGPIGGCIGAGAYADALGLKNVIAFDMGGTTAKCALVSNGTFSVDSVYFVGGDIKGVPIKSPVIDIVEVGSGGGSIARLDDKGQLHVGPESASSTPGPVCYGRGGKEPTVTDANLILGRINENNFLGGELTLDRPAALKEMSALASQLGFEGEAGAVHIADGIIAIATVVMAGAIRRISIEHGLDPRDFVLFAYGGGGPLSASALARELSIPTVIIPPEPGNFSAVGMLLADARLDQSQTFNGTLNNETLKKMEGDLQKIEATIAESLKQEFGAGKVRYERHAEMRYRGQHNNIKVPISGMTTVAEIKASFEKIYRGRFGQINETGAPEFQVLMSSGFATLQRPEIARLPRPSLADAAPTARTVHFGADGAQQAKVYQRFALKKGFTGAGPAVIEEYGSTTLVWPGDTFEIGPMQEIRLTCSNSSRESK